MKKKKGRREENGDERKRENGKKDGAGCRRTAL